ncbi:cyclophilin-like protein, partial [Tilletiaria anomala UBC 951]
QTAENAHALATAEKGVGYARSIFHRSLPDFMSPSRGDFENTNGTGGKSIYDETYEKFQMKYTGAGTFSMANAGPHRNNSQTLHLYRSDTLNGKHVVFGRAMDGTQFVWQIEGIETGAGERALATG